MVGRYTDAIRVVRHIGGRSLDEDKAIPLAIIPYFAGERLQHIRCDAFAATRAVSFPDQPSEINWYAIDVPWPIVLTGKDRQAGGGSFFLDDAAEWDEVFRNLLLEYGSDGSEYYGGEYDALTPDVPPTPGEHADDDPEITRSIGPSGIVRLFSREVLMRPLFSEVVDGEAVHTRFADSWNQPIRGRANRENGGVVFIGAVRYSVDAQTDWGVEFIAARAKGLKALIGGDMSRVQAIIQSDTGAEGDAMRTMLFGGDNFVEADTLKSDPAKAYVKAQAWIATPYEMGVM